jgi:hypothetical protein
VGILLGFADGGQDLVVGPRVELEQAVLLVAEVRVHDGLRDASRAGDVGDRGGLVALGRHACGERPQDPPPTVAVVDSRIGSGIDQGVHRSAL